ncbi:MAG: outer membrane protein assembly factor BamD [Vicinamibacterales bacterium]|jgi:outer membrane protein assembly factor BamD|nr:hypothetical protein [Acidobacteriota bacterium]MDP7294499.1 outer membrane protein assembly factor BamD [Vicinamibacterales bacterium]MDP7471063.1 outer membrane protein assembly factor BamD [Vicinamibacterales bacterium]MDP7672807.1 outer membrane protein assembly factor BamD [Vicinamibacterales bacterium]HJO37173.1 outer membrane protein assembly factor BamD [Vicinamibacterales bacterium]|tara:strand:- start:543 stop:1343 length:801 start_codon:yes stop_codon:yes gene_type:complete
MIGLLRHQSALALTALLVAPLLGIGCAASDPTIVPPGTPEPDRFLFERGTAFLEDEDWRPARNVFRRLVDAYPQSQFRFDAKLALGDAILGQGGAAAQVEAVNEYDEFLRFFPTHPRAGYAQFQIAMAHHAQMLGPDRDQTWSRSAAEAFLLFFELYPDSDLSEEARGRYREVRNRLSEADFQVGEFYFSQRWYPGAIQRMRAVLAQDPEYPRRDGVYYVLAEALIVIGRGPEALPYFERLVNEFETSEYLELARMRIEELRGDGS